MKHFAYGFWVFCLVLVIIAGIVAGPDSIQSAIDYTGQTAKLLVRGFVWFFYFSLVLAAAAAAALIWTWNRNQDLKLRRPKDGAFALQKIKINRHETVIFDPNQMASAVVVINTKSGDVRDVEPGMGWQLWHSIRNGITQLRMAQAMFPGDDVRDERSKAPTLSAASLRALTQNKTPQLDVVDVKPEPVYSPPAYRVIDDAPTAIARSESQSWILGKSSGGETAAFNPLTQAHLGIVGSTGTGKTSSVGFLAAAQAIRHGWHTVILDPDGGEDWGGFAGHAEWHEADRETFADQVRAVYAEYERRVAGQPGKPLFVVIEEYGDMIRQLRIVSRKDADHVDVMLDGILRRGRKHGISLCFVDQYPEHWSPQVIGGTKAKAVFQLGPNQGAKVEEYHAAKLPDRGEFLWRGERYRTWHAKPHVRALLADAPALNGYRVMRSGGSSAPNAPERLDGAGYQREPNRERGERRGGVDALPPPPEPAFDVRSHPKRDIIEWWIDNIGGTQADFRRWAEERGVSIGRGYISDVFNGKVAAEEDKVWTVEDLADLGEPIYVNGQPLGKDPTVTIKG